MTDNDFRQFNGAFDAAMEPDATFTERLQQRMEAGTPNRAATDRPTVIASPPSQREHVPSAARRSHPLFIAAAVLVVIALAAASIVQLAPRVLEPQYASQSLATLPADTGLTPGPDVALYPAPIPGLERESYSYVHGDNLIAVTDSKDLETQQLVSFDLATNQMIWQQDVGQMMYFIFNDDVAIGIASQEIGSAEVNSMPVLSEMVAFDMQTGEEMWSRSIADWQVVEGWETIEMAGDVAIFLEAGTLTAVDTTTGKTRWQADYTLVAPEADGFTQPPALAQIGTELYLAQMDGSVDVFDLTSGTQVKEFDLSAAFRDVEPVSVMMEPVPAGLLVISDTLVGPGIGTTLSLVDPQNGDVKWQRSFDQSGVVNVSPDGAIAVALHTWESPPLLMRLLGREGHSTSALTWLNAEGDVILETDRVRMPDMGPLVVAANNDYACYTADSFVCFDRAGTRYTIDSAVTWDADLVGDTLVLFSDLMVLRVELP